MFCTQCGAELPDNALFCSRCGARLSVPKETASAESAGAASGGSSAPGGTVPGGQPDPQNPFERVSGTVERTRTAPGREAAVVYTEEEFGRAVAERRETIIIRGEIAGRLAEKVRNSSAGNLVSNVAIVAGLIFFWPALVGGIAGKLVTKELKNYEIQSADPDEVVLIRKEKLL